MLPLYPHTTTHSAWRSPHRPVFTTYTPISYQTPVLGPFTPSIHSNFSLTDDSDEEEFLLRAALERKQRERLARQQLRHQQLEQQRLIEQQRQIEQQHYEALLRKERARQLMVAQAQAKEQLQARQEAIQRYNRAQLNKQQYQAAALKAILFQQVHQAQQEQDAARDRARVQALAEAKRQAALERFTHDQDDGENSDDEFLNPFGNLLEALFLQNQKRTQSQGDTYPSKRRQQTCICQQQDETQAQTRKDRVVEQESKAAEKLKEDPLKKQHDEHEELFATLPAILSFVEGIFGGEDRRPYSQQGCAQSSLSNKAGSSSCAFKDSNICCQRNTTAADAGTKVTPATDNSAHSSSQSSPEIRAADILLQRQQRAQQHILSLQQKHSSLNLIDSALDSFARDLSEALRSSTASSSTLEETKKTVLSAEENVSKAMFQIDSVESEGDLSVRQRRKELIKKSQDLLEIVDKYKNQGANTGKKVARSSSFEVEPELEVSEENAEVIMQQETAAKPAGAVEPLSLPESLTQEVQHEVAGDDEDEVVEPYTVTESVPFSSVESATVQDDSEQTPSMAKTTTAVDESFESRSSPYLTEKTTVEEEEESEQAHDDYDILPEF
ncbi:hypothetical protein BGZ54_009369 [Gamsiella multidivaricata]|nr:hypothetical protein BGZ54_009369 [Gamsiella multidivaricata]